MDWPRKKKKILLLVRRGQEQNRGQTIEEAGFQNKTKKKKSKKLARHGEMEIAVSGLKEAEGASPCEVEV